MASLRIEQREDGVAIWTLDRPERKNAIDLGLARELTEACRGASGDPAVRVVVLRGAGGNFCSGGDLGGDPNRGGPTAQDGARRSRAASTFEMMVDYFGEMTVALHQLKKPTVALVEGVAAGAGVSLAIACDLVYAADDARFCEIFVRRALALDCGASWLLPRVVGLQKAKELAFFGEWLSASEAREAGLVTSVHPAGELEAFALARAGELAKRPPVALALSKQLLNRSFETTLGEAVESEAVAQGVCTATDDFIEGLKAFREKREPHFRGG